MAWTVGQVVNGAKVVLERLRMKRPRSPREIEGIRLGGDDVLGEGRGLGQEEPVPVDHPELHVHSAPHIAGRNDVQHGQLRHRVGVVERQAVGAAPAAVVPRDGEPLEAEMAHDLDLVTGHRPLGIWLMTVRFLEAPALAVAPEVGADDREVLGDRGATTCHITASADGRAGAGRVGRFRRGAREDDRPLLWYSKSSSKPSNTAP